MIQYSDITSAYERIKGYIYNTPLERSDHLSNGDTQIYLKLEAQQKLKSFKIRGALSKLTSLTEQEKAAGVIAVSSGNHGAGVSYAAYVLGGLRARIFVPETIPGSKLEKIKQYGAEAVQIGRNYDEAHRAALDALKTDQSTFVDPCSDRYTISGQGSIGIEVLEKIPELDMIVVPIGGGGLITGISIAAKHIKPSIQIVGVQTAACPAMVHALRDQVCYEEYLSAPSLCDALIGGVGRIPYEMAPGCIDDIIEVSEESIRSAIIKLLTQDKVVAEPAGAVPVAAVLENPSYFKGKKTALVISGGNLDSGLLKELIRE